MLHVHGRSTSSEDLSREVWTGSSCPSRSIRSPVLHEQVHLFQCKLILFISQVCINIGSITAYFEGVIDGIDGHASETSLTDRSKGYYDGILYNYINEKRDPRLMEDLINRIVEEIVF